MVAGFLDRVEDVAELDRVAAPAAVADVDARARHVVERAVADGDALRQLDLHRRGLFLDAAREINQAIVHEAVRRIVGSLGAGRARSSFASDWERSFQSRGTRAASRSPTNATPLAPALCDVTASHRDPAVVVVHEDGVAAYLVDEAVLNRAVFAYQCEEQTAPPRYVVQSLRTSGSLFSMKVRAAVAEGQATLKLTNRTGACSVPRNSTRCRRRTASMVAVAKSRHPAGG